MDGARARGVLAGFDNSADLGGLPLPDGSLVPARRVVRANTPPDLSPADRQSAEEFGFGAVLDLRSEEEVHAVPHPLGGLPGYRWVPLIDPAAEAREDVSRYGTLGEVYASSLRRNASHIAAIFRALAAAPPEPALVCCRAGRDRTGMVVALLLDLVGVEQHVVADDYVLCPGPTEAGDARHVVTMLDHVRDVHGSSAGYLRSIGLDDTEVAALRRRLER